MHTIIGTAAEVLATAATSAGPAAALDVMRMLVERLDVDVAFVRFDDDHPTATPYARWPTAPRSSATETTHEFPVRTADLTTGMLGVVCAEQRHLSADDRDTLTTIAALVSLFHARVVAEQALQRDALTRLPDRHALREDLARRLEVGTSAAVTALMIAFTDVAMIRDRLGHDASDEFFVAATTRLWTALAGSAGVYHPGAEEFVVLPLDGGSVAARRLAERLRAALEAPLPVQGDLVLPRVSVGIASAFPNVDTPDDLIRRLSQATRHAQGPTGGSISVLNRNIARTAGRRHELELGIRGAISGGAIRVHYQPEVDLRTRAIVGMEALVRWQHPTLGELLPDAFLGIVESMNLAAELGRCVLSTACADLAAWRAQGLGTDATLRVNVSPRQLIDPAFPETALEILAESGTAPDSVSFEFTEHVMLHDLLDVRSLVERLKEIGFGVAIDDFGTGYSGFTQLRNLPIDALKIDRAFVSEVADNRYDRAIVAAVTALAAAYEIDVVAEGVETDEAAATLLGLGCTYAQGFLFAPPVVPDEMRRLLGEHRIGRAFHR